MSAKKIGEVLKRNVDELMAIPGVIGVGQGEFQGKPCLKVLVVHKTPELVEQVPETIEGFPVIIKESGKFRALGNS